MDVRLTTVKSTHFLTNPYDAYVGKSLEIYGEWSYGEIELFSKVLQPGANVVEVGANIGAHTIFLARDVCPSGVVYAFEPRRVLFQMLCANVVLNGLTNVFAFQRAVGKAVGSIREGSLPAQGPESADSAINFAGYPIGGLKGESEIIIVEPLDEMMDLLKPISLLKADVEGWECDVLIGGQKIIARDRPVLYVENDRVEKSRELIACIMEMNYDLWWHNVPLFRPNNHAHTRWNIFGNICSINMLCFPRERNIKVRGLTKIANPDFHPCASLSSDAGE